MDPFVIAGVLLIAGLVLFVPAAAWPPLIPIWRARTPGEAELAGIARHSTAYVVANGLFGAATVATAGGLVIFALALADTPRSLALAGAIAFGLGTPLWLTALAVRVAITPEAARLLAAGDALPSYDAFMRLERSLFSIFMVAAQLGIAAAGAAIVADPMLPDLLGWATMVASGVVLAHLGTTGDTLPGLVHVMPAVLGIVLLVSGG